MGLGWGLCKQWQCRAQAGAGHTMRAGNPGTQCRLHALVGQEGRRKPRNVRHSQEGDELRQADKQLGGEMGQSTEQQHGQQRQRLLPGRG